MSEDEQFKWENQKKTNTWENNRRHKQALEELFDGNVRYMKFIKTKLGETLVKDGFQATADFTFEKNMGGLTKLFIKMFKPLAKKFLLKTIVTTYYTKMQHVVDLDGIKKLEINPDGSINLSIDKCSAKTVWKNGLRNNNAAELFGAEDYCKYSCIPSINKLIGVVNAQCAAEFEKRGCQQVIKFLA